MCVHNAQEHERGVQADLIVKKSDLSPIMPYIVSRAAAVPALAAAGSCGGDGTPPPHTHPRARAPMPLPLPLAQIHDGDVVKHGILDTQRFLADLAELQEDAAKRGGCARAGGRRVLARIRWLRS